MKIVSAEITGIKLPYSSVFSISKYTFYDYCGYILKLFSDDGLIGFGESVQLLTPWYSAETFKTAKTVLLEHILPSFIGKQYNDEHELLQSLEWIQGQHQAKAAVECAICDIAAQQKNMPLYKYLGGTSAVVKSGVSIGLQPQDELIRTIQRYLDGGYTRIKVKIAPGKDIDVIESVRKNFPNISLMADCNAAYTKKEFDLLKRLDDYELLMLEQPLANGDLIEHSELQSMMKTPICLDESVHTMADAVLAVELNSCKIINIKPPRVGGPLHVANMLKMLKRENVGAWIGGMMETGVGRLMNMACATLPGITLPGDMRPPLDYLKNDIVTNKFNAVNGELTLSENIGLGANVDEEFLRSVAVFNSKFGTI